VPGPGGFLRWCSRWRLNVLAKWAVKAAQYGAACSAMTFRFCNGPGIVKGHLSTRESSLPPGSCFCSGSARGRHLMGFEEDRPANLVCAWSVPSAMFAT
jgi:hypothetical protein